jgi:potassium efflux system protein
MTGWQLGSINASMRRRALALALVAVALWPAAASAQPETVDTSAAYVRTRIAELEARSDLDPALRAKALEQLQVAVASAEQAEEMLKQAAALEDIAARGPDMLVVVEKEAAAVGAERIQALPAEASLDDLSSRYAELNARLSVARAERDRYDKEYNDLATLRADLPTRLTQARQDLSDADSQPPPVVAADDILGKATARRQRVRRNELAARVRVVEAELSSYDERRALAATRRDLADSKLALLEPAVAELDRRIRRLREQQAEAAADSGKANREELASLHPRLAEAAVSIERITALRTGPGGLIKRIGWAEDAYTGIGHRLDALLDQFKSVQQKVEVIGFTDSIGLLLRKQKADLPDTGDLEGRLDARRQRITEAQVGFIELEEERTSLPPQDATIAEVMTDLAAGGAAGQDPTALRKRVAELLDTRRRQLSAAVEDYDAYFSRLVDLDARQRQYLEAVRKYRAFIDENVLWIRSTPVLGPRDLITSLAALRWLVAPDNLAAFASAFLNQGLASRPLPAAVALLALGLALAWRKKLQARLRDLNASAGRGYQAAVAAGLASLGLTVLLAALRPALMYVPAWLIGAGAPSPYTRAMVTALSGSAVVWFVFDLLRRLCDRRGLARGFLRWPDRALAVVRSTLTWYLPVLLPLVVVTGVMRFQPDESFANSLGRLTNIAVWMVSALAAWRIAQPDCPVCEVLSRRAGFDWSRMLLRRLYLWMSLPFMALSLMAAAGYFFTAQELAARLFEFFVGLLTVGVGRAIVLRWMALERLEMARRSAEEKRRAAEASGATGAEAVVPEAPIVDERVDLAVIDAQMGQLVTTFSGVAYLGVVLVAWGDITPAFGVLDGVTLWTVTTPGADGTTVPLSIKLGDLLLALALLAGTVVVARNLAGLLELVLSRRTSVDSGARYAITTISRYITAAIGTILVFQTVGVGWGQMQWLVAAVSVGLGFGLQEIFANFVSGLILLFERPVRIGDTVTLGERTGTVSRIRIRATTLIDWDRKEIVVPNKEFITQELMNWTLTDRIVRVVLEVGIAYGSDTRLAEKTLLDVAKASPYVLADPQPSVLFDAFGDNSLVFKLRCFVRSFDDFITARHALHMDVDQAFRRAHIEISFPQRDLHLRSVEAPIRVEVAAAGAQDGAGGAKG